MSNLSLSKVGEIAADIFDEIDLSYHPNFGSQAILTTKNNKVTVQNTETDETIDLRNIYLRFTFETRQTVDEILIQRLLTAHGARGSMTMLEMLGGFSHPHFESHWSWSSICMGATTLKEVYQAMRHGERIDEDSIYYLLAMLNELLHTESAAGGPYRYMSDLREQQGPQLERIQELASILPDTDEPIPVPEDVTDAFIQNNRTVDILNLASFSLSTSQYVYFFNEMAIDDFKAIFTQLREADIIKSNRMGYTPGDGTSKRHLERINDNISLFLDLRTDVYNYALRKDWCRRHNFERFTLRSYEFESTTPASYWLFNDDDESSAIGINQSDLSNFRTTPIFFKGKLVEKVIEDYQEISLANNNFKYEELTYHELTQQLIHKITYFANQKEGQLDTQAVHGYTRDFVAAARS